MGARRPICLGMVAAAVLAVVGCAGAGPALSSRSIAPPGRLAYVAADDHIYTVTLESGDPRRVDNIPGEQAVAGEVRISRWPTWTADGSRLAFMRLRSGEGDAPATATVWSVAADGANLSKVWESQENVPIYMAWAPDASALGLLIQRDNSLALLLVDPAGAKQPRQIADGSPLYFAWSPDAARLLLHVGGDHRANSSAALSVVRLEADDKRESLQSAPADFRAPAWSPDGTRFGFVAEAPDRGGVLTVADAGGGDARRLAPLSEEAAFIWSPDGNHLAFSSRSASTRPFYQGLDVVKSDGSGRAQLAQDPVMAFFWSPDGTKLAFAAVDRQAQALAWFVSDPAGKNRKQVGMFLPSEEQMRHFAFFDQYALSHGLWSPDSRYLVYSGLPPGTRAGPGGTRGSRVFLAPADGSAEPRALVDGNLAIWPTRTHQVR